MAPFAERILRSPSAMLVAGGERVFRARLLSELVADLERLGSEAIVVTADLDLRSRAPRCGDAPPPAWRSLFPFTSPRDTSTQGLL